VDDGIEDPPDLEHLHEGFEHGPAAADAADAEVA